MPNAYQEYYNTYIEQMVKRQKRPLDFLKIAGIILGTVLLLWFFIACFALLQNIFPILLAALTIFVAYLALVIQNVEYEYDFTMGELDVSVIYSKRRRTRLINIKSNVFTEFGVFSAQKKVNLRPRISGKIRRATSRRPGAQVYYLLFHTTDGKMSCLLFEPNEEMKAAIEKQMKKNQMMGSYA